MKPLNIALEMEKFNERQNRQNVVACEIDRQIQVLERIIENNADLVDSPLTYNTVVGIIEQLKTYAPAIFITAEDSLQKQMTELVEQAGIKKMKPLYGENE
jgi:hypothetical protein